MLFVLAGGVLALVALGGVLLTVFRGPSIEPGADVGVNPPAHIEAHNSPSMARNPTNPDNVVIAKRLDRPEFSAALHWSVDGGEVWGTTSLPLPEGLDRAYGPNVAFGEDGTLYVTYVNLVGRGNVPDTLWLARSDDGGRTLSEPMEIAGELNFQAQVAVHDGTIHVTYLDAEEVGTLSIPGGAPIKAIRSEDGGRTFSEPVQVSDPDRQRVGAAVPKVNPATGNLGVVYMDYKGDVRDFQNLEGPPWDQPFELVFTRSDDGGESFSDGVVVDDRLAPTRRFLVFLPVFPGFAVGDDGTMYAAWADGRLGDSDVFLSRSTDGGQSWSDPARVNDNPPDDGTWQYLPAVSVAPNGRVDLVFHDRRRDPDNVRTDAFVATSVDGQPPFENARVSDAKDGFSSEVGPSAAPHLEPDMGSRLAIDSLEDEALAAWTDTRLGDTDTGRQDVVAARVRLPNPSAFDPRWLLALGVVAALGLAAAGAWARRRPADEDAPEREAEPVREASAEPDA